MDLFFRHFGKEGDPPLIILHGLFGMSDNWVSVGKRLAEIPLEVFIPDQRNHGRSGHSEVLNYPSMVDDLLAFMDERGLDKSCVLGHSMGGKVAMQFAVDYPERIDKLVVADISPASGSHGQQHERIIDALLLIDLQGFSHRNEALEAMSGVVPNARLRQFLQKNLYWKDRGNLGWRMNLPVIRENLEEIFQGVVSSGPVGRPSLFIRGGLSDYVVDEDLPHIRRMFPESEIVTIEEASHWLHAEQPEAFVEAVRRFIVS